MTSQQRHTELPPGGDWPPTLLGWLLARHFPDQEVRINGEVVRWTLDPVDNRIEVRDGHGSRLASVQLSVVWDPSLPGPQQGRELAMHFDVVGWNAPADGPPPDPRVSRDVEQRIARLGRWLLAVERRLPQSLAELFPRDAEGLIEWESSPLLPVDADARTTEPGYIKLGNINCGLSCVFCTRSVQPERKRIPALFYADQLYEVAHTVRWADPRAEPAPEVTVGGDEPLYHPDLLSLLRLIRLRGYRSVLQTSSAGELDADRIRAFRREGLSQVQLPIYGATAAVHDDIVGKPGHFEALLRAVEELRAQSVSLWMHSVVLPMNLAEIPALTRLAEELSGQGCGLLYPRDEGASRVPQRELLVRLTELPAQARRMLNFNVPCLQVGRVDATPDLATREMVGIRSAEAARSMQHHFGQRCEGCQLRPLCHGLPGGYLERFGEQELRPR